MKSKKKIIESHDLYLTNYSILLAFNNKMKKIIGSIDNSYQLDELLLRYDDLYLSTLIRGFSDILFLYNDYHKKLILNRDLIFLEAEWQKMFDIYPSKYNIELQNMMYDKEIDIGKRTNDSTVK